MTSATLRADARICLLALLACSACDRVSWLSPPPSPLPAQVASDGAGSCRSAPTWESFGEAWLRTWCTPCHSSALPAEDRQGAPAGVDFDTYASTLRFAQRLVPVAGSSTADMPPAGGPSAADQQRLIEWVECGLPGNGATALPCSAPEPREGPIVIETGHSLCDSGDIIVQGDLTITDTTAPCVCGVEGTLTAIDDVSLPVLQYVTTIDAYSATHLSAPQLAEVADTLEGGHRLVALELRELQTAGVLRLVDAPDLVTVDLTLLQDLQSLEVRGAPSLAVLRPRRLRNVAGDVALVDVGLEDLEGFDSLRTVGGDLRLESMERVTKMGSLPSLESVGGDLVIHDLPSLLGIEFVDALVTVGGDIRVSDVPAMVGFVGMNTLIDVGGVVSIQGPTALRSLRGLAALESAAAVHLEDHAALTAAPGLAALRSGGLILVDLDALSLLPAPNLETAGTLQLTRVGLPSLAGWAATTEAEELYIAENPFLASIEGLEALTVVHGDVTIRANPLLDDSEAWRLVEQLSIGGGLEIADNGGDTGG